MEVATGSDGEKKKPPEVENKTKRKMKTALQLEILEKNLFCGGVPLEALRVELSAKLGLSDRQLQMWFCHRRLKDQKVEVYPSEALRVELSAKLRLSDWQLQMWFCHRRLKDRKGPSS